MSIATEIIETKGAALRKEDSAEVFSFTMMDYLASSVNFDIPSEVIVRICVDRDIDYNADAMAVERNVRNLCKADLLVWMVYGVSRKGNTSDTDNGWNHTDGGYTLTEADKALFLKAANAIYEENGEKTIGKTSVKIQSYGIRPADFDTNGQPQPHIIC